MNIITTFAIIIGALLLCWILLSFRPYKKLIKLRSVNQMTSICALPEKGQVEIAGTLGHKVIQSPMEKTDCVYWQLAVEELFQVIRGSMAKGYHSEYKWKTLLKRVSAEPIEIEDTTGKILLKPKHIDLRMGFPKRSIELDEQKLNTLKLLGIKTANTNGITKELAVYEQTIAPGLHVHVIGEIKINEYQKSIINPFIFTADKTVIIEGYKKQIRDNIVIALFMSTFLGVMIWLFSRGNP